MSAIISCLKNSAGKVLSKIASIEGMLRSASIFVEVRVSLSREELDNERRVVDDKLGLLVAEVDREFAVEFLVRDLDLDREDDFWEGIISMTKVDRKKKKMERWLI